MKRLLTSRIVITAIGVMVIVSALGVFTYFAPRLAPFEIKITPVAVAEQGTNAAHAAPDAHDAGVVYHIGDSVVNLADTEVMRYLKANIALEFASEEGKELTGEQYKKKQEEFAKKLANRKERIGDVVTTVLSSYTASDLITPSGKEAVRSELKERLAEATAPEQLLRVYFTQFIIQ